VMWPSGMVYISAEAIKVFVLSTQSTLYLFLSEESASIASAVASAATLLIW